MVNRKAPQRHSIPSVRSTSESLTVSSAVRALLDSLSREQRSNQDLLSSLGFAIRSFTNLHSFLELVPVFTSRLVGVDGSLLVPFQENGSIWREHLQVVPIADSQELLRQLASFKPGTQEGFGRDGNQILEMDRLVQRHMAGVGIFATSIVSRGRERGRLYVFDPRGSLVWSEAHRRNVQLVADLTGVAIENDCSLQLVRRHESVDRQLTIGAEIQAQLLPDHCPVIEGVELSARCRPAYQVGGDYYDFMPTRPELTGRRRERSRWALVVGDVMGKGVPAGLLMTMLRGMLRAEVLSGLPPDRILHDLNQLALEDLAHSHRFVTLFYSDYDPRSRRLRFANAAHNPPLLWRSQQRSVTRLDAAGLLIGLQAEAEYVCGEIVLEPGDVILYYTDGVTEASGMAGDRFNESRLIRTLEVASRSGKSSQGILDDLFSRLDAFVGPDHHLEDDASMVVLKIPDGLALPSVPQSIS